MRETLAQRTFETSHHGEADTPTDSAVVDVFLLNFYSMPVMFCSSFISLPPMVGPLHYLFYQIVGKKGLGSGTPGPKHTRVTSLQCTLNSNSSFYFYDSNSCSALIQFSST